MNEFVRVGIVLAVAIALSVGINVALDPGSLGAFLVGLASGFGCMGVAIRTGFVNP